MKTHITLGSKVRCIITGFVGIATVRVEYINGCVQYGLKAPMKKGETAAPEAQYFDESQLEVVGRGVELAKRDTGGPTNEAPGEYRG